MQKEKIQELSVLTTFYCICVIMIHISSYPVNQLQQGSLPHMLFFYANKSLSFVVPGFVFFSGLKLTYLYLDKPFQMGPFLKKRFTRILFPYCFWYVAYYCLFSYLGYVAQKNFAGHLTSFLWGDLVSPFYFIPIILQFYLVFGLLLWILKKLPLGIFLTCVVVFQFLYFQYLYLPHEDRIFPSYLLYFALGMVAAKHISGFRKSMTTYWPLWFVAFLGLLAWHTSHSYQAVFFGSSYPFYRSIACLFSVAALATFYGFSVFITPKLGKIGAFCTRIENKSYQIFLSHCFFLYIANEIWARVAISSIVNRFLLNTCLLLPFLFFIWIYLPNILEKYKR